MKKIVIVFIMMYMLCVSPVYASKYENNSDNNYIQYKLDSSSLKEEDSGNYSFWIMLVVAFFAISMFIIAYKSDDGSSDD